ncbi:MAG: hypothetical protein ACI9H6_000641 [Patiriisocius sp.]|jgi:hypothetical protein
MELITILLAVIAYILWRIYRQREDEKDEQYNEKIDLQHEEERRERFKDYPHLYGKLEGNWLDVFASQAEGGTPLLKLSFMLMLQESTKIDFSDGSMKWDSLWDITEELLEHLGKYHEGSVLEHEIAITTFWQVAAEAVGKLIEENPEIEGHKMEVEPFTNINKIAFLFPKKGNHPDHEIDFFNEDGSFPRESKGSELIKKKMKELGL